MANEQQTPKGAKPDEQTSFAASEAFPDAKHIFTSHLRPLAEIQEGCLVVLDTNVLLVPYTVASESLQGIEKTFRKLLKEGRLLIPSQVTREFAANRPRKLVELHQALSEKKSRSQTFAIGKYPLLEGFEAFKELRRLEEDINRQISEYQKAFSKVIEIVRGWTWDDPVSSLYRDIFSEAVIVEATGTRAEALKDIERRKALKIPPGYKDASKEDGGSGDILIWQTILEIGCSQKKDVIFVSGDEKPDWWHRSAGIHLYPRFELVDEFYRISGGKSFHIVNFSKCLELFGAEPKVVEEVREREVEAVTSPVPLVHGPEIRMIVMGPRGDPNARIGEMITAKIKITNADDFGDSLYISHVHVQVQRGTRPVESANLLRDPIFLMRFGDKVEVEHTFQVIPGDGPFLFCDVIVQGLDNRDGEAQGEKQVFYLTFPGLIKIVA